MAKKTNVRNTLMFHDYYSRLKTIALAAFEWHGLPGTCNERFLEECLFNYGQAVFVEDPGMSFLNLKVTPSDTLNVYNEPLSYAAFSAGYHRIFPANECVIIRNNLLSKSTDSTIMIFAEKMADIDVAATINIKAQKTPVLIRCDEKTRLSLENIYGQYDGNRPVIFGAKSLEAKPLEVLRTEAPFLADRLREEKRAIWNEALEFLGFNTNPSDKKKERLIVNEVNANNEQIDIQAESMLLTRQMACENINKMFGLNVGVERRVRQTAEMEVAENG